MMKKINTAVLNFNDLGVIKMEKKWLGSPDERKQRIINKVRDVFCKISKGQNELGAYLCDENKLSIEEWVAKNSWVFKFIVKALDKAPDYFWTQPSSTTGQWHPSDEFCEGGLALHVFKCLRLAEEMLRSIPPTQFDRIYLQKGISYGTLTGSKEIFIAAVVLHDLCVSGKPDQLYYNEDGGLATDPLHAIYVRSFLEDIEIDEHLPEHAQTKTSETLPFDAIMRLIESHYGIWSPLPQVEPNDFWTRMVHYIDYIVSRNFVQIDTEDY